MTKVRDFTAIFGNYKMPLTSVSGINFIFNISKIDKVWNAVFLCYNISVFSNSFVKYIVFKY